VYQVIKFPTGDLSLQFVRMIHSPICVVHEETATIILAPVNDNNNYSVIDLRILKNFWTKIFFFFQGELKIFLTLGRKNENFCEKQEEM
jgi:hypothetical protein